ncbi:hypothetical protein [Paenibacillus sp. Z3-2]
MEAKSVYSVVRPVFQSYGVLTIRSVLSSFLQNDLGIQTGLEAWSGISISISFLISGLCAPFWGSLADRYGSKLILVRSGVGLGIAHLANFFVYDPYTFIVGESVRHCAGTVNRRFSWWMDRHSIDVKKAGEPGLRMTVDSGTTHMKK